MNKVEIIEREDLRVDDSKLPSGPILVHRADIASIARSLLLIAPSREFSAGIIAMTTALGIEVKRK